MTRFRFLTRTYVKKDFKTRNYNIYSFLKQKTKEVIMNILICMC